MSQSFQKRCFIGLFLLIFPLSALTFAQEETDNPENDIPAFREALIATINGRANIRDKASSDGELVVVLTAGTDIIILEEIPDGEAVNNNSLWYKIELEDAQEGYIWSGVVGDLRTELICAPVVDETGWQQAIQTQMDEDNGRRPTEYVRETYIISVRPENKQLTFIGVYDGEAIIEPIEVLDKDGELLFTSYISFRLYYLDSCNHLRFIIVPYVIQFPTGMFTNVQYNNVPDRERDYSEVPPPSEAYLVNRVAGLETDRGMLRGSIVSITLSPDVLYRALGVPEEDQWFRPYIEAYYESYAEEFERFVETGDPSIRILPTILISFPSGSIYPLIELP